MPPPPSVLSPQVSPAEEGRLRELAATRIGDAEQLLGRVDQRKLGPDQQQTLSTVHSFLAKAREALSVNDFQRAVNLADKARILADELARRAR